MGAGTDGKCGIVETGSFPYSPAFLYATSPSPSPSTPLLSLHQSAVVRVLRSIP